MPITTFIFNKNNFTKSTPDWATDGEYSKGLRFNTVTKTLQLNNENYKKIYLNITFPPNFDFGSVHLSTPNGSLVSLGEEEDKLYLIQNLPENPVELVFKDEKTSTPKTYYAIVNGDPDKPTSLLNISIALAKEWSIPSSDIFVTLNYDCDYAPLYEYETGLHVYSPYDAKSGSARLTTKLYSNTAITNWDVGTKVYSNPYFSNPALPYYYGYNGKVYRVGDDWSRSYGVKFKHTVRVKKRLFRSARVTQSTETIGPFESLSTGRRYSGGNSKPTSEACIEPVMKNVGVITEKFDDDSIFTPPPKYRYYLGYDSSDKRSSNDSVFTDYHLSKKQHYPTTGLMHALKKLTRGIISGYDTRLSIAEWFGIVSNLGLAYLFASNAFGSTGLISGLYKYLYKVLITSCTPCYKAASATASALGPVGVAILVIIIVAVVVFLLVKWFISYFRTRSYVFEEDCKKFLHHFTTGNNAEYIQIGGVLYRDTNLSEVNNGYYCDGVYYYTQTEGSITIKELSYTYGIIDKTADPPSFELSYSLPADNPTLVEEWLKLILLPYCSGKPIPYCGEDNPIYYSPEYTHTIDPHCCDLEICESKVITLPASSSVSCISQADANAKGLGQISASISYAENYGVYTQPIDDSLIGTLDTYFTHEIKQEDIPTEVTLYFDNRSGSDAPVNTPLYYDFTGCQKALPGYYATSGSIYPKYYYKVANGKVTNIYTQSSAASTTVTPGNLPIVITNTGSSSSWYLKSNTSSPLISYIMNTNDRTFNVNSLFTSTPYELSAGHIISGSYSDGAFKKYASYNSNGVTNINVSEQGTGWYMPLNDWKPLPEDIFYYQNSLTSWIGGPLYAISQSAICTSTLNTTRYHDGEGNNPSLGDKIYHTNDITDPIGDGFIKYTSDYYLQVVDGVVTQLISCTLTTEFSGSQLTSSISGACNRSTNEVLYEHNGSSSNPAVGDTVSVVGGSAVSNGFINTSIGTLQTDSDGMIVDIIDCSEYTGLPLDMVVGYNGISGYAWYGYSNPDFLHFDESLISGDGNGLINGFLNDSLGESSTDSIINWHLITWLGQKDNNVYMVLRKTNTLSNPLFEALTLTGANPAAYTHLGCPKEDWGAPASSTKIYLPSSTFGGEDYATSIVSGMNVTGVSGIPANTIVTGTPTFSDVFGYWEVPVNNTITYSDVCGQLITFGSSYVYTYNKSSAIITNYSNITDLREGTADYIVYKWSNESFPGYLQSVKVNFTYPLP